ncbi:MAG: hypothetical protein HZC41_21920 [Chloroflexi bacterium]|nr:hypothetical protein [Chloroflexota bacterium]
MSKAKFDAAREFIQEKRYDEARAILRTISHPEARAWLAKLDHIAPSQRRRAGTSRRLLVGLAVGGVALIGVVIIVVGIVLFMSLSAGSNKEQLLREYCYKVPALGRGDAVAFCQKWVADKLANKDPQVEQCYAESNGGQIEGVFGRCMFMSGVIISTPGPTPTWKSSLPGQ